MPKKCSHAPLYVVAIVAVVVALVALCAGLASVALWFERLSVFLLIVDDFFVRVFASIILLFAVIGIVWEEYQRIFHEDPPSPQQDASKQNAAGAQQGGEVGEGKEDKKAKSFWDHLDDRNFALVKFAALAGLSGISFVLAEQLDKNDDPANLDFLGKAHQFLVDTGRPPRANATVLARWVQVVPSEGSKCLLQPGSDDVLEDTSAACPYDFLVRAVVPATATSCPGVRVAYDGGTRSQSMGWRNNPYQAGFGEIKVCEARITTDPDRPLSVALPGEASIPLTTRWVDKGGPKTVSIIGDTGCRASNKQICDKAQWPFADVIAQLAPTRALAAADLVIHVGDFMYVKFDAWDAWKAEFFDPATPLLQGAPWLMVRGNHERCGKFGDAPLGYYLFFDIGDTNAMTCAKDDELTPTYAVDISTDRRVIVSDSATAWSIWALKRNQKLLENKKGGMSPADTAQDKAALEDVKKMLRQVGSLAEGAGDRDVWFATHVPVFSLGGNVGTPTEYVSDPASFTMREAWYELGGQFPKIDAILAGHLHLFQIAEVKNEDQPLQIISGAGGVNLDDDLKLSNSDDTCISQKSLAGLKQKPAYENVGVPINKGAKPNVAIDVCSNINFGQVLAAKGDNGFEFTFVPLVR